MKSTCDFPGCGRTGVSRGLCPAHRKQRKKGQQLRPISDVMAHHDLPIEERFWLKVRKGDGCWEWLRGNIRGYGLFTDENSKNILAHRYSWKLHNGDIPDGLHVLHKCDNPPCVRPDHLFLGTPAINAADKTAKGRGGSPRGERHGSSKLTMAQVSEIRSRAAAGHSCAAIGSEFGISRGHAWNVARGKYWNHDALGRFAK